MREKKIRKTFAKLHTYVIRAELCILDLVSLHKLINVSKHVQFKAFTGKNSILCIFCCGRLKIWNIFFKSLNLKTHRKCVILNFKSLTENCTVNWVMSMEIISCAFVNVALMRAFKSCASKTSQVPTLPNSSHLYCSVTCFSFVSFGVIILDTFHPASGSLYLLLAHNIARL